MRGSWRNFISSSCRWLIVVISRHGVWRWRALWQRQQRLLELGPWQREPRPLAVCRRDGQQPRWRPTNGAGASGGARCQKAKGTHTSAAVSQLLKSAPSPVLQLSSVLSLTELLQKCVQVSMAQLWQGAHIFSWNKKTHPCAASGVSRHNTSYFKKTFYTFYDVDYCQKKSWAPVLTRLMFSISFGSNGIYLLHVLYLPTAVWTAGETRQFVPLQHFSPGKQH